MDPFVGEGEKGENENISPNSGKKYNGYYGLLVH
jgi:hypothetical protein